MDLTKYTIFAAVCLVLAAAEAPTGYDYPKPTQQFFDIPVQKQPTFDIVLTGSGSSVTNNQPSVSFDQGYQYSRPVEPIIRPVQTFVTQPAPVPTFARPLPQYVPPVKIYPAPVPQYIPPVRPVPQYGPPVQTFTRPVQRYVAPVQQYIAPVKTYVRPVQQYIAPVRPAPQYVAPVQTYTRPVQTFVRPAVQQYVAPVQTYVRPVQQFVAPVQPRPIQQYIAPQVDSYTYNRPAQPFIQPEPVRTFVQPTPVLPIQVQESVSNYIPPRKVTTSYEAPIVPPQLTLIEQETPKFNAQVFNPQVSVIEDNKTDSVVVENNSLEFQPTAPAIKPAKEYGVPF